MEQKIENISNLADDPIYQELVSMYPNTGLISVEVILKLMKVVSYINSRREAQMIEHGLTSGRFYLLMLLKRQKPVHMLSPSDLAKLTGVTRGTMTQFIDAIEKDGFVTRVEDPFDRRRMLVKLTDLGDQKTKEILPIYLERMVAYTKVLSDSEKTVAVDLLEKMSSTLSEVP